MDDLEICCLDLVNFEFKSRGPQLWIFIDVILESPVTWFQDSLKSS